MRPVALPWMGRRSARAVPDGHAVPQTPSDMLDRSGHSATPRIVEAPFSRNSGCRTYTPSQAATELQLTDRSIRRYRHDFSEFFEKTALGDHDLAKLRLVHELKAAGKVRDEIEVALAAMRESIIEGELVHAEVINGTK